MTIVDKPYQRGSDGKILLGCTPTNDSRGMAGETTYCERCKIKQASFECKEFVRMTEATIMWGNKPRKKREKLIAGDVGSLPPNSGDVPSPGSSHGLKETATEQKQDAGSNPAVPKGGI